MHTASRPPATNKSHTAVAHGAVPRTTPAANHSDCRGPVARFLFGTPGDFLDRHPKVLCACVMLLLMVGSGL